MIVPKSWITLREVRERLLQHVLENENDGEAPSDTDAVANELCWDFCEHAKGLFLHAHAGKVIEYPKKSYVEPPKGGKHLQKNDIVDLTIGIPGTGIEEFKAVGAGPKVYDISGPNVGSPILFKRGEFEKFLLNLKNKKSSSQVGSIAWVKDYLLEMHKLGTYTNKATVWEELQTVTYWTKYDAGFKAAKKEDPTFGKVGAPPKANKKV